MSSIQHILRIHGDNILECESALKLLSSSLNGGIFRLKSGPAYAPIYEFESDQKEYFEIQLFAGYGRWGFPLVEYIASLGGTLREAPDAIITRLEIKSGKLYERPILAFEFSGALPAGNNAWQRTGRALALAYAGIPYLYFAELGGQELDASRVIKAARFPNPLVPFAYAVLGMTSGSISLPVYIASPSSNQNVLQIFRDCFGKKKSIELVRSILLTEDQNGSREKIEAKVLNVLRVLAEQRKRNDILTAEEWTELHAQKTGLEKAEWLIKRAMPWNKKIGLKGLPPSFYELLKAAQGNGVVAIGSKDMPISLIPANRRARFGAKIKSIYGAKTDKAFIGWLSNTSRPLLCVWVAGFKPRGDDSRPDRGLVPLARMIFGMEDVDVLTVVYGPAKPSTWSMLQSDIRKLAATNGLWEAIVNLSNGILINSSTSTGLKKLGFVVGKDTSLVEKKLLPAATDTPNFGEHDVDSILHLLFSHDAPDLGVYEALCNPPGGDWSGVTILEAGNTLELRWTSLPRVSGHTSKRPDHITEFIDERAMLAIESKDTVKSLEPAIGPRLIKYVGDLLSGTPTAVRSFKDAGWAQYGAGKIDKFELFSGAAFRYESREVLRRVLTIAKVDIVFGIEFQSERKGVIIHIVTNKKGNKLLPQISRLAVALEKMLTVEIH